GEALMGSPMATVHDPRSGPRVVPGRPGLHGVRVLIVDDDREFREVMQALLEARGASVTAAHDGRKGLSKARKKNPDVVLLDQWMPDMPGTEVARELRNRGERAAIVIVTAAREAPDLAEEA